MYSPDLRPLGRFTRLNHRTRSNTFGAWGESKDISFNLEDLASAYGIFAGSSKNTAVEAAEIEAKIANYEDMKAKFPLLSFYYDNQIRTLQAQLGVLSGQAADEASSSDSWQTIGMTLGIVGICLGVAAVAYVGVKAYKEV